MMTNNLYAVHASFEGYALFLGVGGSYIRALRIAANYRKLMKSKGWKFEKRGKIGTLHYLEFQESGIGINALVTFEIESCELNKMVV